MSTIYMGDILLTYEIKVIHPDMDTFVNKIGGKAIDVIADESEAPVGIFEAGQADRAPIIWTRNRSFITTKRDSLRHDLYPYFLDKLYDRRQALTNREKAIREFITRDD